MEPHFITDGQIINRKMIRKENSSLAKAFYFCIFLILSKRPCLPEILCVGLFYLLLSSPCNLIGILSHLTHPIHSLHMVCLLSCRNEGRWVKISLKSFQLPRVYTLPCYQKITVVQL